MRRCSTGPTGAATWCGRGVRASLERGGSVPLCGSTRRRGRSGGSNICKEDRRGLRVIGRLSDGAAGREAAALLKEGAVRGLSFGYRVRAAQGEGPRELIDLELVEVSLVTLPMQPRARVHALEGA